MGFGIGDLIKGGAQGILEGLGGTIAKVTGCFKADPTEVVKANEAMEELKLNITVKMAEMAQQSEELAEKKYEAMLKDTANARDMNAKVQESDKASWLAKNISFIIDIFIMLIWGTLTVYIVCRMLNLISKDNSVNFEAVLGVYAAISTLATTVVNFHRGSSKGSEDKSKIIGDIAKSQ